MIKDRAKKCKILHSEIIFFGYFILTKSSTLNEMNTEVCSALQPVCSAYYYCFIVSLLLLEAVSSWTDRLKYQSAQASLTFPETPHMFIISPAMHISAVNFYYNTRSCFKSITGDLKSTRKLILWGLWRYIYIFSVDPETQESVRGSARFSTVCLERQREREKEMEAKY